MSLLRYRLIIEIPIAGPSGDPPYDETVMGMNETTAGQVEFTKRDGDALRKFVAEAWKRGKERQ